VLNIPYNRSIQGGLMKKYLIILLIVAGICYYYNPPLENHIESLSILAPEKLTEGDNFQAKIRENLDFINFYVASATKDRQRLSIVTFGCLGRVFVIDKEWLSWLSKGRP
jgi:hypothetical protein